MSVSATKQCQIVEGRFVREEVTLAGDGSGGTATITFTIPRGFRVTRAHAACRLVSPVTVPRVELLIIGGEPGGLSYKCGWKFSEMTLAAVQVARYTNDNVPFWTMPRSGLPGGKQVGLYAIADNTDTGGVPDITSMVFTLLGEIEPPDLSLREAQNGRWSVNAFFRRLDEAIFGTPRGLSTP